MDDIKIGNPDQWPEFAKRNAMFLDRLEHLRCTFNEIFNRKFTTADAIEKFIFMAGHLAADDFMEILILCGNAEASLADFDSFCAMVLRFASAAKNFSSMSILDVEGEPDATRIAQEFAALFDSSGLTTSPSPSIVPTSKLLHFLLPDLIPPIDRKYSLRFFFGRKDGSPPPGYPVSEVFRVVFTASVAIGMHAHETIRQAVQSGRHDCPAHAKVIDNAVIGYVKGTG